MYTVGNKIENLKLELKYNLDHYNESFEEHCKLTGTENNIINKLYYYQEKEHLLRKIENLYDELIVTEYENHLPSNCIQVPACLSFKNIDEILSQKLDKETISEILKNMNYSNSVLNQIENANIEIICNCNENLDFVNFITNLDKEGKSLFLNYEDEIIRLPFFSYKNTNIYDLTLENILDETKISIKYSYPVEINTDLITKTVIKEDVIELDFNDVKKYVKFSDFINDYNEILNENEIIFENEEDELEKI